MSFRNISIVALVSVVLCAAAEARPFLFAMKERTFENQGCPPGSYSVITSPDGAAVSVLFDKFTAEVAEGGGASRISCGMEIPLKLPDGYALAVYNVDYRGYARLAPRQAGVLAVNYGMGGRNRDRRSGRAIRGAYDGEYMFTDRLGGSALRNTGCGGTAVLNFNASLTVMSRGDGARASMTLDTIDGAPSSGLVFGFDLKPCRPET